MTPAKAARVMPLPAPGLPLAGERYDRRPTLSAAERAALEEITTRPAGQRLLDPRQPSTPLLERLTRPLLAIRRLGRGDQDTGLRYLRFMYTEMARRGTPFWTWTQDDWRTSLATCYHTPALCGVRPHVRAVAYVLCDVLVLDECFATTPFAQSVFGPERIATACERVARVVFGPDGAGFSAERQHRVRLCAVHTLIMLLNRTPALEAFSVESVRRAIPHLPPAKRQVLRRLACALVRLGLWEERAIDELVAAPDTAPPWSYTAADVHPRWLSWVQAYLTQTRQGEDSTRHHGYYALLIAGR